MVDGHQNQEPAVAEWKRRFQRETKVNKELGRRLRETKRQLQEEKLRSQELSAQLLDYKKHCCCEEQPNRQNDICSNCELLEGEIAGLKQCLLETTYTPSHELSSISLALPLKDEHDNKSESTPESNADQENSVEADVLSMEDPSSIQYDAPSLLSPARELSCTDEPVSTSEETTTDDSNQMDHDSPQQSQSHSESADSSFCASEFDESSLGALLKYAVVLAGPAPAKPKPRPRLSFSDRFKTSDFQRTRSLPEYEESSNDQHDNGPDTTEECTSRSKNAPAGKWKALSPGGGSMWLLKRQSQTVLDITSEYKVSSPLRRAATGLFSNLVPNSLRSSNAPSGRVDGAPLCLPLPPPAPTKASSIIQASDATPASKLLCVFPPNAGEVQELEGLLEICFPYGDDPPTTNDFSLVHLKRSLQERHRTYRSPDSTFVLTIASASNPTEVTYAICVRCPLFPDKRDIPSDKSDPTARKLSTSSDGPTQCCLCLLSPYPFFGLFFKVLYGIAVLWNTKRTEALKARQENKAPEPDQVTAMLEKPLGMLDFVEIFQGVMERLNMMRIPSMGGWSHMVLSSNVTHLAFHRPHSASLAVERRHLLLEYAAPTLFGLLSVDQVLFLLGCLCCERKVLVVSDHVNIVSSCVLALITLLHPLQWAGPVITVLPPRLDELLEAPVPLIAGRVSINSASIPKFSTLERPMKDVIEMNMDQNALHMHGEDLVTYHELKLPECDELVHELEPFSALLFGKHREADFPTVRQDEACKIMCARIHRHIESICSLAMAGKGTITGDSSPVKHSERAGSATSSSPSSPRASITVLGSRRQCSAMVADYILRFQETQMFSMFTIQSQDEQNERDAIDAGRDDSENEEHDDEDDYGEENGDNTSTEVSSDDPKEGSAEPEVVGVDDTGT